MQVNRGVAPPRIRHDPFIHAQQVGAETVALALVVGLGDTGTGAQRRCSCGRQARQGTSSNTCAGHGARGGVCIHRRVRIASPADARARGEEEITADELPATV